MPLSHLFSIIESQHDGEQVYRTIIGTVLDTIIDGVIILDRRGTIETFNKACFGLFGYAPQEVLGRDIRMLLEDHEQFGAFLENRMAANGLCGEIRGRRKNGSIFPLELTLGTTRLDDHLAYVGILRDISERKEAEAAREQLRHAQKMEAIGQLTGGIAHDFNNLLAVIVGNLDFLSDRIPEGDPLQGLIRPATEAALQGSQLTRQLLAFSRKQALQPQVLSMNELVDHFLMLVKRTIGERIGLVVSLQPDIPRIFVDRAQLENAILNLTVNARDAMPDGGKLIYETFVTELDEDYTRQNPDVSPGHYVVLAVSDTGSGMPRDVQAKAFEPFFTTKAIGKGSGLGLSMVYGFMKQSGGHIKIYSEIGQGTTVRLYLPVYKGNTQGQSLRETQEVAAAPAIGTRVLVVEDNAEVLKLTAAMLEDLGYRVTTAETGDEALALVTALPFDLILYDVMLPGTLNGPAMVREAKALQPDLKVLLNSGYAEQAMLSSGILDEDTHLISKPFRKPQLAKKIAEILGGI